ncbi:MAG: TetR/AcrR family transcriptional regulator [Verrucomicrobia bacterium]|nr:TetR/AcrR family transcriptional regulator [Verrucomicrobiota bacterium]
MPATPAVSKEPPSSNSEKRAAQIFRVAAELIQEKGYDATSMNDIAKKLKLTKAGLYYYINGKNDLLYSIIKFGMQNLEDHVIAPCREIADPEERLRQIIERHTVLIMDLGGALTILSDEVQSLPAANRKKITDLKRGYLEFVRKTLNELKAQKKMCSLNADIAAMNLFAVILGVARWYNPKKGWTSKRISKEASKFIMGAVLK